MKTKFSVSTLIFLIFVAAACVPATPDTTSNPPLPTSTSEATISVESALGTPTSETDLRTDLSPVGVLSIKSDTDEILLTTVDGEVIDELVFHAFTRPKNIGKASYFHFGGTTQKGVSQSPCFFISSQFGSLYISFHQSWFNHFEIIDEVINLTGAPQQPIAVFSSFDPVTVQEYISSKLSSPEEAAESEGKVGVESALYHVYLDEEDQPKTELLITQNKGNGDAIYPLAVELKGESLEGVWYTQTYLGIVGIGPIAYTGYSGLYYFDLESNQELTVLEREEVFLKLSFSQTRIAYMDVGDDDVSILVIRDLDSGILQEIDLLPQTNVYNIGNAHFSPSGANIAWQEHILEEDSFDIIFRFASVEDGLLQETDTEMIIEELSDPDLFSIKLAGWLDESRVVIEAISQDDADLYILDLDDLSLSYLAPGRFMGFTY